MLSGSPDGDANMGKYTLRFSIDGTETDATFDRNVESLEEALAIVAQRDVSKPAMIALGDRTVAKIVPQGTGESRFWRVE